MPPPPNPVHARPIRLVPPIHKENLGLSGSTLYEQRLIPITEGEIILPVLRESWRKYGRGAEPTSDAAVTREFTWLFEIVDRET